jgi:hypothetical protein
MEAKTVAELIAVLETLPREATVFTRSPPFTGVIVIPQENGSVGIFEPSPEEIAGANGAA